MTAATFATVKSMVGLRANLINTCFVSGFGAGTRVSMIIFIEDVPLTWDRLRAALKILRPEIDGAPNRVLWGYDIFSVMARERALHVSAAIKQR